MARTSTSAITLLRTAIMAAENGDIVATAAVLDTAVGLLRDACYEKAEAAAQYALDGRDAQKQAVTAKEAAEEARKAYDIGQESWTGVCEAERDSNRQFHKFAALTANAMADVCTLLESGVCTSIFYSAGENGEFGLFIQSAKQMHFHFGDVFIQFLAEQCPDDLLDVSASQLFAAGYFIATMEHSDTETGVTQIPPSWLCWSCFRQLLLEQLNAFEREEFENT